MTKTCSSGSLAKKSEQERSALRSRSRTSGKTATASRRTIKLGSEIHGPSSQPRSRSRCRASNAAMMRRFTASSRASSSGAAHRTSASRILTRTSLGLDQDPCRDHRLFPSPLSRRFIARRQKDLDIEAKLAELESHLLGRTEAGCDEVIEVAGFEVARVAAD